MDRWSGKVAVVTGASSGIGLETAKVLVHKGMIVVGLARRKEKMLQEMNEMKGSGTFIARECDITKQKDVSEAFEYIKNTYQSVHILINNAGILNIKSIENAAIEELEQVINVNLMGVLYCSKEAIKLMKANNHESHIININSVAGHNVPTGNWADNTLLTTNVYSPSKFALKALSKVFSHELQGSKIRVTNLSPGYVKTEILRDIENIKLINAPYLNSEDIANAIMYVIGAPAHVQISEMIIEPLGK